MNMLYLCSLNCVHHPVALCLSALRCENDLRVCQKMPECYCTDVYGAAQQRSSFYGSTNDAEEVGGGFAQLVHLRHATCKVLEALGRAAP